MMKLSEAHSRGRVRVGQTYEFRGELYTVTAVDRNGLYSFEDMNGDPAILRLDTPEGRLASRLMRKRAA